MAQYLETDLAYIAGFVDGEGHIVIQSANQGNSFVAQLGISNTNYEILNWIQEIFDGYIYDKQKIKGRKQGYQIRWNKAGKIQEILTLLLPYLKVKRVQAELVIEFLELLEQINLRTNYGGRGPRPTGFLSEEFNCLEELCFGVSLLNRRGE